MTSKFEVGQPVAVPNLVILGKKKDQKGTITEVYYDDWNDIYKYRVHLPDFYTDRPGYEWFVESELRARLRDMGEK